MHQILGSLVAGAIAGEGARKLTWRPLFKRAFKGSIRARRGILWAAASVSAETSRLIAEAQAELDGPASFSRKEAKPRKKAKQ